jgi:hypothetical protein
VTLVFEESDSEANFASSWSGTLARVPEAPLAGTEDRLVRGIVEMTPVISGSRGYHARVTMG